MQCLLVDKYLGVAGNSLGEVEMSPLKLALTDRLGVLRWKEEVGVILVTGGHFRSQTLQDASQILHQSSQLSSFLPLSKLGQESLVESLNSSPWLTYNDSVGAFRPVLLFFLLHANDPKPPCICR